jgi:RNA polymerase sigma-70 factor (ECF subfamily)
MRTRVKEPTEAGRLEPALIQARAHHDGAAIEDEESLVRAAKARSPAAWTQIYDANYRKLFRYALARTSDRLAAEDIASSVFVEALKNIDSFNYRGKPLLAWLYAIARHLVSKHLTAQRRRRAVTGLKGFASRLASSPDSGGRAAAAEEEQYGPSSDGDPANAVDRIDLRQALHKLTEDQKEVTVLYFYAGLTIPEISRLLGKRERAVYSLHARALGAMRRHLLDGGGGSSTTSVRNRR